MMAIDSTRLLKRLEPAIRPGAASSAQQPRLPIESQPFEQMLALVSQGRVSSGRAVQTEEALTQPLNESQMSRLAAAADLAEGSGAQSALMLIDGRALVMDVASRMISRELAGGRTTIVPLDAAVYVAGDADQPDAAPLTPKLRNLIPPSVASQIEAAAAKSRAAAAIHPNDNRASRSH